MSNTTPLIKEVMAMSENEHMASVKCCDRSSYEVLGAGRRVRCPRYCQRNVSCARYLSYHLVCFDLCQVLLKEMLGVSGTVHSTILSPCPILKHEIQHCQKLCHCKKKKKKQKQKKKKKKKKKKTQTDRQTDNRQTYIQTDSQFVY